MQRPTYDLEQSYAGSAAGRLAGLETKRANGSVARQFIYGYETASPLLKSLAIVGNAFQVTRTFEAKRDLLTQIDSKWSGGALRTSYAYAYNDLRQRATAVQGGGAGEAFAELGATHQRFAYNSRGELTAGTGYHGSDPAATDKPLDARLHAYDYDAIGNRKWSNSSGNAVVRDDYTANDLNQYTQRENNTLAVSGTANASAKVAVSGPMPAPDGGQVRAGRPTGGTYWGSNVVVNNAATTAEGKGVPFVGDVKAYAALAGAGAGGADLFRVETKAAWLPPVVQAFAYDVDGNLTSDGLWDYRWDAENRLIRMQTTGAAATVASAGRPNQTLEFTYDYRHRRVKKKVINMATSTVTSERKFIYDGWNVIAETDGGGTLKRSFAWGLDISGSAQGAGGVGGLLQIHDYEQTKTLFPCYDGNGNIGALINAEGTAGTIEASYEYTPFGELQRCAGAYAAANPFRFSTKWQDDESGLVYYGARYYAPREGRFLGRDPIEEEGGLNLYGFCGNDAVNSYDYLGYSFFSSIGKFFKKYWKPIVAIAAGILTGGIAAALAPAAWSGAAVGALAGGVGGFVGSATGAALNGASLGGVLRAGLIGGTIGAISGGILGKLGTFQGFSSQMKFSTYLGKMAEATTVGAVGSGTAAELNGGNFRDGFESGAAWSAGSFVVTAGLQTYLNEKGETVYPEGGSKNSAQYKDVTTNGILGDPVAFQAKVTRAGILGYYNPSQGIINDVMQSLLQKTLFGWGDSLAKGFATLTSKMMPGPLTITAHSQGTLTVTNAIFRGGVPDGSVLNLRSPAISYPRAWLAGQVNHSPMNYIQPWGDGANLWSPSLNPLKLASGVLDIFAGAKVHTGNYP